MERQIFNGFYLEDDEILSVISQSMSIINKNAKINGVIDEDLKQEMVMAIYEQLTHAKRKNNTKNV